MRRKIIFAGLIVILAVIALSNRPLTRYEGEFLQLFDTHTKIVGYAGSKGEFEDYSHMIYDALLTYHQLYDIYHEYEGIHNLKTVNDQAGLGPVKVDRRIIDLLLFAREGYEASGGKMNIALGAVLKIWHDYREAGLANPEAALVPPMALLTEAAKHTDIRELIIDEEASTVYFADPALQLDVGSVAKGYAAEQVSRLVQAQGFTSGLISVGGNVRTIGKKNRDNLPWNVGIQNPVLSSEAANLLVVNLEDLSLVTSGSYQRYYTVGEERYHHIIDPDTLLPAAYFQSVSVIARDSGMADVLTTALFNLPFEEGKTLIEARSDVEALWVFPDGEIRYSEGFSEYIAE